MHHIYIGVAELGLFWEIVRAQDGQVVSPLAASVVLRCSHAYLYDLLDEGELDAWSYHKEPAGPAVHSMVCVRSLVRHGVRTGRFQCVDDLSGLRVSEEEFAAWKLEALKGDAEDPLLIGDE